MQPMKPWTIVLDGVCEVVIARSWLVAIGIFAERMSLTLNRMAAETLPNGVVLVHDMETGNRFVVHAGLMTAANLPYTEGQEEMVLAG